MKHLKLFQTEAEYTTYKNGTDFITPNVSYTRDNTKVYYNAVIESISSYNMVDLGLPSGLKWADRNVGATSPEDAGLYFQWGDTIGYTPEQVEAGDKVFNWDSYFDTTDGGSTFNKYATDKLTVLEATDDAATVNMGSSWRMPTHDELTELINNTTPTFIDMGGNEFSQSDTQNGAISEGNLKGIKFTGSNGNSIFVPAAGMCENMNTSGVTHIGATWTSSLTSSDAANILYFSYNSYLFAYGTYRYDGMAVRGVSK